MKVDKCDLIIYLDSFINISFNIYISFHLITYKTQLTLYLTKKKKLLCIFKSLDYL